MENRLYPMYTLLSAAETNSRKGNPCAIGAFNVNFYAQAEGIIEGLARADAPGIIQASKGACKFQNGSEYIRDMVLLANNYLQYNVPIALHLDHGNKKSALNCVDNGFSSVMIDASNLKDSENIRESREVADYAHKRGISVEAELGKLSGVEEDIVNKSASYTNPDFVPTFIRESMCDALAISYGTSHGPNKGKTDALDVSIVKKCYDNMVEEQLNLRHFLVSHGSSTVPKNLVENINEYGGNLFDTHGVPEYKLKEAITSGIRKVNIDTDLRLGITGIFREEIFKNPDNVRKSSRLSIVRDVFEGKIPVIDKDKNLISPDTIIDPRDYLGPVITKMGADDLRNNYRDIKGDPYFVEVMDKIKRNVAGQVHDLCLMFGSAGIVKDVNYDLTLEKMAKHY